MDEIKQIMFYYNKIDIKNKLSSKSGLKNFSCKFYKDVTEIYDTITRIKNPVRNPSGFAPDDAAILGLLIRIWKILKEIVYYYRKGKADITCLLDRQIVEAAVIAKYLLTKDKETIEDYRKCSYKNRLKILTDTTNLPELFQPPALIRLKQSIVEKMKNENLDVNSFATQNQNKWKISGKNFSQIFSEIEPPKDYKYIYGIGSESIHGSWNDSMDFHLIKNDDGTFSPYPYYASTDIRYVTPLLRYTNDPYLLWLERIDAKSEYICKVFKWIKSVNKQLYISFEKHYKI